jgi:hypothetical protein
MPGRRGIVALALATAVVAAITVVASSFSRPEARSEVGIVVSVDSASLTNVRAFAIRTPDGRTIQFRIGRLENGAEFPPGHLAEHKATAAPIRVTYRDENGEHVAFRLDDATTAAPT